MKQSYILHFFIFILVFIVIFSFIQSLSKNNLPKGLQRIPTQAAKKFEQEGRAAIIVGIDEYSSRGGFKPLKYAVSDAKALEEQFRKFGYRTDLILNSEATKGYILDAIKNDENLGTLVFIFTGHGFSDKNTNYLAIHGTTKSKLSSTGLSLDEVKQEILKQRAKRNIIFIDACRDNPIEGNAKTASILSFKDLLDSKGLNILYSTGEGQQSYEHPDLEHGVFSYFLIKGLKGEAAQKDGLILFDDLTNYVTKKVKTWAADHKQNQIPFRSSSSSGQFLVGLHKKNFFENLIDSLQVDRKMNEQDSRQISTSPNANQFTSPIDPKYISRQKDQLPLNFSSINVISEMAQKGDAEAQRKLGYIYSRGEGVKKDLNESVKWYRKAAEQDEVRAQLKLGYIYSRGEGVRKDLNESVKWYSKAAQQGSRDAQAKLAEMYYKGKGVDSSKRKAVIWYRKAADQGSKVAQRNIGLLYEFGEGGLKKDYKKAISWYKKAKRNGHKDIDKDIYRVLKK